MTKEQELVNFLDAKVFRPVLQSSAASASLKSSVTRAKFRAAQRDAMGMVHFFWASIVGIDRNVGLSNQMKDEGFDPFDIVIQEFRTRFNDAWLKS